MTTTYTLDRLNQLDCEQFIAILGSIFEHSPWVAEQACGQRPFSTVKELHQTMVDIVDKASTEARTRLICSHPELAGKEASAGTLTSDSHSEQASAGLDQCSPQEFSRLNQLNAAYRNKFNFPFIIAVRGRNRHDIMEQMEQRLNNTPDEEFDRCIEEIARIAELRLNALIC